MNESAVEVSINRLLETDDAGQACERHESRPVFYYVFHDYFNLAGVVHELTRLSSVDERELARQRSSSSDMGSSTPLSAGTPTDETSRYSPFNSEDPFVYYDGPSTGTSGRVVTNGIARNLRQRFKIIVAMGRAAQRQVCVFCRNNGESESVYATHSIKASDGRITCPVLRAYTCPICGAHGDEAHTIKYCPRNLEAGEFSRSVARPHGRLRNATGRRK